ncbi:acyl-CoA thioesterase [Halpernia sp.]|uniref:acyl-CoA thioesterase n=1 Tax=Halpernia sp. TaxID=2782209 RepID=UPI003A9048FD
MSVFQYKFDVRWSDIDANRHLANSSYVEYCAQTRMAFMNQEKIGLAQLSRWGIGPVILHERYSFFKEILGDQTVWVTLEVSGASEDASIYRFLHKFYFPDGTHCATSEATGVWIDTMLRKATTPPDEILEVMEAYKDENCKILTREDLKNLPFKPENVEAFHKQNTFTWRKKNQEESK